MSGRVILRAAGAERRIATGARARALNLASVWRVAGRLFALVSSVAVTSAASAQPSEAGMAPIDAYMMIRSEEITLAKSAAPDAISSKATVLVLTPRGYETAVRGSNEFVCWVGRGFSGAPDWPERWNPKIRAAECENPQAARSVLPIAELRTRMILAGRSDTEIMLRIKGALKEKEIAPLEPGAMSYMMSKSSYLTDKADVHNMAHVMFFVPSSDGASWGANVPGAPFFGGNYWYLTPGHDAEAAQLPPLSVLLMGAATWSDGTRAGEHRM